MHADAVAARLRSADSELAALTDLTTGTVRLAAFPSAAATMVPPVLAGLSSGVTALLSEAEPPEALEQVESGAVDAALVFSYDWSPPVADHLVSTMLTTDAVRLVVPAGAPATDLVAVATERWIAGCVRCREHLLRTAAAAGFTPDVRHSTDDYVVVQSLIAAGLGVALLPTLALRAFTHPGVLVVPAALGARTVSLVHHVEATRTPAVRALAASLRDAFTRVGQPRQWDVDRRDAQPRSGGQDP